MLFTVYYGTIDVVPAIVVFILFVQVLKKALKVLNLSLEILIMI